MGRGRLAHADGVGKGARRRTQGGKDGNSAEKGHCIHKSTKILQKRVSLDDFCDRKQCDEIARGEDFFDGQERSRGGLDVREETCRVRTFHVFF